MRGVNPHACDTAGVGVCMRRPAAILLASVVVSAVVLAAQSNKTRPLEIYAIDTEGGQSTLYVSPAGQTCS
jgi:hypothetical protein